MNNESKSCNSKFRTHRSFIPKFDFIFLRNMLLTLGAYLGAPRVMGMPCLYRKCLLELESFRHIFGRHTKDMMHLQILDNPVFSRITLIISRPCTGDKHLPTLLSNARLKLSKSYELQFYTTNSNFQVTTLNKLSSVSFYLVLLPPYPAQR